MDFPFAAYPDNFRHWAEVLLPIYNFVEEQQWPAHAASSNRQIDTLVLTNLRKEVLSVSPAIHPSGSEADSLLPAVLCIAAQGVSRPCRVLHTAIINSEAGLEGRSAA